jgi:DNA helicase HerA-like ATPase
LAAAAAINDKLSARATAIGFADYAPRSFPVEFFTLDRDGKGVRLRASVSSFGPILLSKVLDLNETQQSVLALAFKYSDDKKLPLINLADLRALLNHLNSDEGKAEMAEYGGVATATVGVIVRKIVELEQQEADAFFGSPEFEASDFLRVADDGRGIISILELADMQDRPALFSTFMMWLLASLYESLPEVGDIEKPKLVFFFDEAHLLFRDANKTFMQQIELVARLIRSKGVGVFFVTHAPTDVPAEVLGQLGNRVQHALRAFTPDDLQTVRATADTFPTTDLYDVEEELTSLGTGEALITALDPKGRPMPTARTMMRPPMSLMAQVEPAVFDTVMAASAIAPTYAVDTDPESARELLTARMKKVEEAATEAMEGVEDPESPDERRMRPTRAPERGVDWGDLAEEGARFARSGTFNTILRSILGILGKRR